MREGEGGGGDGQTCRAQPQPPGRAWRHLQGAHRAALHGALALAGRGGGTEVTCDTLELVAGMVVGGESLVMTSRSMSSERGWITIIRVYTIKINLSTSVSTIRKRLGISFLLQRRLEARSECAGRNR